MMDEELRLNGGELAIKVAGKEWSEEDEGKKSGIMDTCRCDTWPEHWIWCSKKCEITSILAKSKMKVVYKNDTNQGQEADAEEEEAVQQIDVGGVIYLLLFNPFTSFAGIISRQLGNGREMEQLCYLLGNYGQNPLIHYLPEASAVLQLLISAVLLVTAGRKLNPLNK